MLCKEFLFVNYCSDMFRPKVLAIFRALASFSTCAAHVSTYVAVILAHVPHKLHWLPTPFASFPFTSPPLLHRVPSHFNWTVTFQHRFVRNRKKKLDKSLIEQYLRAIICHESVRRSKSLFWRQHLDRSCVCDAAL